MSVLSYIVLFLTAGASFQAVALDSDDDSGCVGIELHESSEHCHPSDSNGATEEKCSAMGSICTSACNIGCSAILPLYAAQNYQSSVEVNVTMLDVFLPNNLSTSLYRPPRS